MIYTVMLSVFMLISNTIARIKEERGQDVLEYAVIVGAIGIVAAVAFFALDWGVALDEMAGSIYNCVDIDSGECGVF